MTLFWIFLILALGVLLLYAGAELLVLFASRLAISLGMSSLLTGLTVVAFCTSMPELVSSLIAKLGHETDMAVGNIVGSNIANISLILGSLALFKPVQVNRNVRLFEAPLGIIIAILLWLVMLSGHISRAIGALFILLYLAYFIRHVVLALKNPLSEEVEGRHVTLSKKLLYLFLVLIGALVTIVGGALFIKSAVDLADHFQISGRVVGLTLVAVGSSLPEFAASFVALIRKQPDIAVGNIFGSNILNILFVLGVVALVGPLYFSHSFLTLDVPLLIGVSLLVWLLSFFNQKLNRLSGALLLLSYVGYLFLII